MDSCIHSTVAQDGNRISALRPTRLHMPRSYQIHPTSFENSIRSTISRCPSLPSFQLPKVVSSESSFRSRVQNIRRPSSANTIRRSVSGMKRLLPLTLSTPPIPSSTSWTSPVSDSMPELGPQHCTTHSAQLAVPDQAFAGKRHKLTIQPEKYRDTTIYSGPNSPLLSRDYYTDEAVCCVCSPGPCDESCIIQAYSSNEDSEPESAYTDCLDFSSDEDVSTPATSPAVERTHHSELSFKCLGDTFFDEGSWLRSTSRRDNIPVPDCLPQRLAESMPTPIDIEGWISDSTSSSCNDSEGDDDFACATALAPAKVQFVDVNRGMDLNIIIPPRSSSLARMNPEQPSERGRKSRMAVRSEEQSTTYYAEPWSDDEDDAPGQRWYERIGRSNIPRATTDLAMASPPMSPDCSQASASSSKIPTSRAQAIASFQRSTSFLSYPRGHKTDRPKSPSNITEIIEALERCIGGFPSRMLLLDAPCIPLIRSHLQEHFSYPENSPPALESPFPTPAERRFHRSPLRAPSKSRLVSTMLPTHPSHCPRPLTSSSRTFPSLSQLDTTLKTSASMNTLSYPLLSPQYLPHESRPSTSKSSENRPESESRSTANSQPNLQPFRTIFPKTSDFMRSALYAHILAYIYIATLAYPCSPHHLPFPLYSSRNGQIPSKAASTLGIPTGTKLPIRTGGSDPNSLSVLVTGIEDGLSSCIRRLVGGMEGRVGWSSGEGDGGRFLDRAFLRALVEVVRGCEMRDLGTV